MNLWEMMKQNSVPHQQGSLWDGFNLGQWMIDRLNEAKSGVSGWFADQFHTIINNGKVTDNGQYGDGILFELFLIAAIVGVFMNMAGFKKQGNKMVLGSFLGAVLMGVLFSAK